MALFVAFIIFIVVIRLPWVWWWEKVHRFSELQKRAIDAEEMLAQQQGNVTHASFDDRRRSTNLVIYGVSTFICFVYVVTCAALIFTFQIKGGKIEYSGIGAWGPVGDFFGGMLNPVLAFASFIALLYTIRIQSEELRLTRDELSKSVMAQQQLVDSQNAQTSFSASLEDYNSIRQLLVATLTELRANFYANSESHESIRSLRVAYQVFQLKKEIDLNQIDVWHVISIDFRDQIIYDQTLLTRGSILCNLAYDALSNYEHISSIANSKLKGHFQASLKSYAESVAIYIVFAKLFAPKAKYGKSEIRCKMLFEELERICREKELPAPPVTLFSTDPA